jgi:hypothetical protein
MAVATGVVEPPLVRVPAEDLSKLLVHSLPARAGEAELRAAFDAAGAASFERAEPNPGDAGQVRRDKGGTWGPSRRYGPCERLARPRRQPVARPLPGSRSGGVLGLPPPSPPCWCCRAWRVCVGPLPPPFDPRLGGGAERPHSLLPTNSNELQRIPTNPNADPAQLLLVFRNPALANEAFSKLPGRRQKDSIGRFFKTVSTAPEEETGG